MHRRDILKATLAAAALPALSLRITTPAAAAAPRAKITNVRITKVKVAEHLDMYKNNFRFPSENTRVDVGGFAMTEIFTDQGAIGIGPATTRQDLDDIKDYLIGKDPMDVAELARYLAVLGRGGVACEVALWDLAGKIAGQPLYKLWGGGKDRVMPYGATYGIGDGPEERGRAAAWVKSAGFKAVKMRSSFPLMKDDVRMMELARKAIGEDTLLLVDANKAGPYAGGQMLTIWDHQRAYATAMEFKKLNTYWLEEPLGKWDYKGLHDLKAACGAMRLAGGEGNTKIDEFLAYMQNDCYDVLNCDVGVCGPTVYRQAMDVVFAFGKTVVPHASGVLVTVCHLHTAAITPQPVWGRLDQEGPHLEILQNPPFQDFRRQWSCLVNQPMLEKDGFIAVPQEPGLGVGIKPELIDRS